MRSCGNELCILINDNSQHQVCHGCAKQQRTPHIFVNENILALEDIHVLLSAKDDGLATHGLGTPQFITESAINITTNKTR